MSYSKTRDDFSMQRIDENKLDNPVWYALSEKHQQFSIDYEGVKFYHPDYCPFGGFNTTQNISKHIIEYAKLVGNFFIVGARPELPDSLALRKELVCLQMLIDKRIEIGVNDEITALGDKHSDALFQLVTLVQPGYFKKKTASLGNYCGIINNGQLVAVTGERMIMNEYVEVSAIVTHPDHTGLGYAKQLIAHVVNDIFDRHKQPYLHVAETNFAAIALYEKLGFTTRRKISFWNIGDRR